MFAVLLNLHNNAMKAISIFSLSSLLLLLHCCIEPIASVSLTRTDTLDGHCVVVLENSEVLKEIGSIWVSAVNPCAIHACGTDDAGQPHEIITEEDCGQFYCALDSELRPENGTCCGTCVPTKCTFNGTYYDIGHTWRSNDDCTLLECVQLPSGQPMINAYQKTCPPLPPDCPKKDIIEVNCCQQCQDTKSNRAGVFFSEAGPRLDIEEENEDMWTPEFYRNHPCVRECRAEEAPMTCRYTFAVEWYETLSKACYDCPRNLTDCSRPHCIVGDGIPRSITVVNRMMPGPAIEVCEGDTIIADVRNHLLGESTTIHWHGLHQRDTPYMDGVPHITQCPISPHANFRYTFKANNEGTHFWHSHTGMQRGDGVFGALIIRRPKFVEPHKHLYDFDLSEHTMILQDWVHVPGVSMFASHHHSRGDNKPINLLVNGKGRYYKAIWDEIKQEEQIKQKRTDESLHRNMATTASVPNVSTEAPSIAANSTSFQANETLVPRNYNADVDIMHPIDQPEAVNMRMGMVQPELKQPTEGRDSEIDLLHVVNDNEDHNLHLRDGNEIVRLTRNLVAEQGDNTNATLSARSTSRPKRSINNTDPKIPLEIVPLHVWHVKRGFRYRFRIINAEFLNCPINVAIDNHTLTAINSDGYDFEPVEVGSIVTYAGERFDFVLNANQPVGNYWVRLKGLMDCSEKFTSAFQVAILRYDGAPETEPEGELGYHHKPAGIELNVMNQGSGHVDSLTVAELTALQHYDAVPGIDHDALKPVADYKFFVYYDFYAKDNPVFHPAEFYSFNDSLGKTNRLFTPQLNHISLKFPSMALLPSRDQVNDSMFCNDTSLMQQGIDCRKQFCKCHHVLQVPLNSVVEFIIVDEGFTFDANHPFHLHGNAFRVVGLERLGENVTIEMVKQLDRYNLLKRNLVRPPIKDTVTVPDGGYTIIRFEAYNPGFWLFHCHIEFHAEIGMALVLKVGDNDQMAPVPKNFPTCNDYMPDIHATEEAKPPNNQDESDEQTVTEQEQNSGTSVLSRTNHVMLLLIIATLSSTRLRG